MSGANLSHDYFTNRQDRYVLVRDCERLADFFEALVDAINEFSFRVDERGECVYARDLEQQQQQQQPFGNRNFDLKQHYHPYLSEFEIYCNAIGNRVKQVFHRFSASEESEGSDQEDVAYIYPLVQMNDAQIRTDQRVTNELFARASDSSRLYLAAGYFNLTNEYIEAIARQSKANFSVLLASPEANGFFNGAGFSKHIPLIYSHYEEEFFKYMGKCSRATSVSLFEYKRPSWTFHAKGIWYYPKRGGGGDGGLPTLTVIGSSNYGYRSVYKDVEAQLLIFSPNANCLQARLDSERKYLFESEVQHAPCRVTAETFASRRLPVWLKLLARTIRSYF